MPMLLSNLRRIPEFRTTPIFELRALAERTHVLCIPPGRWLIQSHDIAAYCYLLKGNVQTFNPDQTLRAASNGALTYFYPGCDRARTLSAVQIIRIESSQRDFLVSRNNLDERMNASPQDIWLQSFLGSHMMNQLNRQEWAKLLSSFEALSVAPGEIIIQRGDTGEFCYVVESGHGLIHREADSLRHVGPGDFFGEDALITGTVRNATVTALSHMILQRISGNVFRASVLDKLVDFVHQHSQGILLNIGKHCISGAVPMPLPYLREQLAQIDPYQRYYIVGGNQHQRALCAFLLIQQGISANPIANPDYPSNLETSRETVPAIAL